MVARSQGLTPRGVKCQVPKGIGPPAGKETIGRKKTQEQPHAFAMQTQTADFCQGKVAHQKKKEQKKCH